MHVCFVSVLLACQQREAKQGLGLLLEIVVVYHIAWQRLYLAPQLWIQSIGSVWTPVHTRWDVSYSRIWWVLLGWPGDCHKEEMCPLSRAAGAPVGTLLNLSSVSSWGCCEEDRFAGILVNLSLLIRSYNFVYNTLVGTWWGGQASWLLWCWSPATCVSVWQEATCLYSNWTSMACVYVAKVRCSDIPQCVKKNKTKQTCLKIPCPQTVQVEG